MHPNYEAAPLPANEEARNERVHRSGVMDVDQPDRWDIYVDLAKLITDCPVAYTGLLDEDRQFFLAQDFNGLIDATEVPRNMTLCQYALGSTAPTIVPDLREHEKLKNNPLVLESPHWVFWGAYPLVTNDGLVLGTLCTVDYKPRVMSPEVVDRMVELASNMTLMITLQMEERGAVTERMSEVCRNLGREYPEMGLPELEGFLSLCAGNPVSKDTLGTLIGMGLAEKKGIGAELSAMGREVQGNQGLSAAMFRRKILAPKATLDVEDLFAMME